MATFHVETEKVLHELKVSELRTELEKRGIDKTGIKAALIERLEQALKNEGNDVLSYRFNVQEIQGIQSPKKMARIDNPSEQALDDENGDECGEIVNEQSENNESESVETGAQVDDYNKEKEKADSADVEKGPEKAPGNTYAVEQPQLTPVPGSNSKDKENEGILKMNVLTQNANDPSKTTEQIGEMEDDEPDIIIEPPKKTIKQECVEVIDPATNELKSTSKRDHQQAQKAPETNASSAEKQQQPKETAKSAGGEVMVSAESVDRRQQAKTANTSKSSQPKQQRQQGSSASLVPGSNISASLWIRNITTTTKAADLKALFSKHGKVVTAKIFTTKNKQSPTCFGYVTLADADTADVCAQKLNRLNFKGRIINVEKADRSNLSQLDKGSQQLQCGAGTSKTSDAQEGKSATEKATEGGTSSSSKQHKRPRITAIKESPIKNSSSVKKKSFNSSKNDYDRYGTKRAVNAYGRRAESNSFGKSTPIYRRIVQSTTRGIRVAAPMIPAYGSHSTIGLQRDFAHKRPVPYGNSRRFVSSEEIEREEMLQLMRQREEEHRKKEEELRMDKEREKLKYEREKLERERLELEHMKLAAQFQATAGWMQPAGLSAVPMAAVVGAGGGTVSAAPGGSLQLNQQHATKHHRHSAGRNESKKDAPKSASSSSAKGASRAKESSSRSHRSSGRFDNRGRQDGLSRSGRVQRSRSRSPLRRSTTATSRAKNNDAPEKSGSSSAQRTADWSVRSRYISEKREADGGRSSYGTASNYQQQAYNSGSGGGGNYQLGGTQTFAAPEIPYGKQNYPIGGGSSASYDRRTSSQGGRFYNAGSVDRYGEMSTNADSSSYTQRVGPYSSSAVGGRDEVYGGHGGSSFGDSSALINYTSSSTYARDQPGQSSYQPSSTWDRSADVSSSSRSFFVNPGSSGGGGTTGGGGWNRQTENILSDWNLYDANSPQKQSSSSAAGRYQQQSSSYGGRSGSSSMYPSATGGSGRRY